VQVLSGLCFLCLRAVLARKALSKEDILHIIVGKEQQMTMSTNNAKQNERVYKMIFGSVYPLYINKAERKGRTKEEVDKIILWLTGYSKSDLQKCIRNEISIEDFFNQALKINPNVSKITGVVCGIRVEEIEDEIIQRVRYLDKLIDELAKGKAMEKILRV
jgi:hypothetical protein